MVSQKEQTQNSEQLKLWKAEHPEIKVVTKEDFELASDEKKAQLLQNKALILNSQVFTLKDIEDYELTH